MKWYGVRYLLPDNLGCGSRMGYKRNKIGRKSVVKTMWENLGAIILFSLLLTFFFFLKMKPSDRNRWEGGSFYVLRKGG